MSYMTIGQKVIFRTGKNTFYLRFRTQDNRNLDLDSVMIEEGENATNIIRQVAYKKNINLKEPLRGLPNGVKDRIIKKDGQWVVERNCAEIVLDGYNAEWRLHHDVSDDSTSHFQTINVLAKPSEDTSMNKTVNVVSDLFMSETADNLWNSRTLESICSNKSGKIGIRIKNSRLSSIDSDGLNEWLRKNPITIVYQLPKPQYEILNVETSIRLFEDTTHILSTSNIPCNMNVTVDRVANRAIEFIEMAKANPSTENLSQARYWVNLMSESALKEELQEDINGISDISDVVLEKKYITTGLDIYLKSENMLSLSLNTNSIVFDNFSGVEDMVKDNAVNLMVNSSLPYQLNAYLEDEIQNADKSKTMDKSILKIKENSETAYKTFNDIKTKLVLKDSCSKGNGINHSIDLKLKSNKAFETDTYKTVIKLEVEQK